MELTNNTKRRAGKLLIKLIKKRKHELTKKIIWNAETRLLQR